MLWRRLFEETPPDGGGGETPPEGETPPSEEGPDPEIEAQARKMGWKPKDQWKGDTSHWIDASEYVERGKSHIPFLQSERQRMEGELQTRDQRLNQVSEELRQTREQLRELTEFNRSMAKDSNERRKTELGEEIRAAREANDPVKEAALTSELNKITQRGEELAKPPEEKPPAQQPPQIQPWVKGFLDSNAEFFGNQYKTTLFNSILVQKRAAGDRRVGDVEGTAFLSEIRDEVNTAMGSTSNSKRSAPAKTEESRSPSNGSGGSRARSGAQTYASLPADAKAQCDKQQAKFVGPDKAFKKVEDWQRHYVREYYSPSAIGRQN